MDKKKILLIMSREIISDSIIAQSKSGDRFDFYAESDYMSAVDSAIKYQPRIVILEVPESGSYKSAEKCLLISDEIRKHLPRIRQLLLCSETDAASRRAAIQAKQNKRIDDFLFYDTSVNYLFSKLESLI
ncbi:MAG: hypothetical protein GX681_04710 [Clostridiaceae bacterium]|jgi:hypothetical protein|nr:hypothetical protein [Clostridiaceae bacterium]